MPRIAQICTYYRTNFYWGGPQTPFQYNFNRDIEIEHNYTVFFSALYYKPQYPILRFYAAVTFCLFGFFLVFWNKVYVPPPSFRRRATPLVLLVHIKQKLKCTSVIMHILSYLSIRRLSLHPFESHSFCRPSRICIFDFLSRTAWWIFVNLGRDEVFMFP